MPGFGDLHQHLGERIHSAGSLAGVAATYRPASGAATTAFLAIVDSGGEEQLQVGQIIARTHEITITVPVTLPGTAQDRITIDAGPFAGTTWIVDREQRLRGGSRDLFCVRQEITTP